MSRQQPGWWRMIISLSWRESYFLLTWRARPSPRNWTASDELLPRNSQNQMKKYWLSQKVLIFSVISLLYLLHAKYTVNLVFSTSVLPPWPIINILKLKLILNNIQHSSSPVVKVTVVKVVKFTVVTVLVTPWRFISPPRASTVNCQTCLETRDCTTPWRRWRCAEDTTATAPRHLAWLW